MGCLLGMASIMIAKDCVCGTDRVKNSATNLSLRNFMYCIQNFKLFLLINFLNISNFMVSISSI